MRLKKIKGEEIKVKKRRVDGGKKSGFHSELKVLIVEWFTQRTEGGASLSAAYREFELKWESDELEDEWRSTLDDFEIVLVARDSDVKGQKVPSEKTIRGWMPSN